MTKDQYKLSIRIAGNTENPCLLALLARGYELSVSYTKLGEGDYCRDIDAEKDGRRFSATRGEELLGLVVMWEHRGDEWRNKPGDLYVLDDLDASAVTYDREGNVLAVGDEPEKATLKHER